MKIKFLVILCMILLVGSVSAYLPHQQHTELEFSVTSNNATSCNVTNMDYPDGMKVINQEMTRSGQTFNASIDAINFDSLGNYCFSIICSDDSTFETGSVCREVTPNGFLETYWFYILVLALSGGVIILGFSIKDAPMVIIGSFGLYFLGIYILLYGLVGIKDVVYTYSLGITTLAVAGYISIKSAYELIVD